MQQIRLEPQKGDDLRTNAGLDRPLAPVVQIGLKLEVNETVAQRSRHRKVDATLRGGIAGRDDHPSLRQYVLAKLAIKNELIAPCLRHLRGGRQFIEKENAFAGGG